MGIATPLSTSGRFIVGGAGLLPIRSPGQSGWTAPVVSGPAHPPDTGRQPARSGGPPWGPAPRPPDLDRYPRRAGHRVEERLPGRSALTAWYRPMTRGKEVHPIMPNGPDASAYW